LVAVCCSGSVDSNNNRRSALHGQGDRTVFIHIEQRPLPFFHDTLMLIDSPPRGPRHRRSIPGLAICQHNLIHGPLAKAGGAIVTCASKY
jgi:hypothetical protein